MKVTQNKTKLKASTIITYCSLIGEDNVRSIYGDFTVNKRIKKDKTKDKKVMGLMGLIKKPYNNILYSHYRSIGVHKMALLCSVSKQYIYRLLKMNDTNLSVIKYNKILNESGIL